MTNGQLNTNTNTSAKKRTARISTAVGLTALAALSAGLVMPVMAGDTSRSEGRPSHGMQGPALPIEEILSKVMALGYTDIREIERKHGVYKVKALNAEKQKTRIVLDAQTGEVLKEKTKKGCG